MEDRIRVGDDGHHHVHPAAAAAGSSASSTPCSGSGSAFSSERFQARTGIPALRHVSGHRQTHRAPGAEHGDGLLALVHPNIIAVKVKRCMLSRYPRDDLHAELPYE